VRHPGQQILRRVYGLGEILVLCAGAKKLGAHRENGGQVRRRQPLQTDEQIDEQAGLLRALAPGVSERLLELIQQDADVSIIVSTTQVVCERRGAVASAVHHPTQFHEQ
jgi:hypothetical protein